MLGGLEMAKNIPCWDGKAIWYDYHTLHIGFGSTNDSIGAPSNAPNSPLYLLQQPPHQSTGKTAEATLADILFALGSIPVN
jgi:hypothetical protein